MSEKISIAEYYNRVATLDFYYGYADDPKAFRAGSSAYRRAAAQAELGDEYRAIWRAFNEFHCGRRDRPKPAEFDL